jgi:hypothetical protein
MRKIKDLKNHKDGKRGYREVVTPLHMLSSLSATLLRSR